MNRIPNLFIVGAPKSGTTSIRDWLGQRDDVFVLDFEPCFFCTDIGEYSKNKGLKWYLSLFYGSVKEKYIVDKSAFYLYSHVAPKKIREFNPDAKIIAILRDPKEQMLSNHKHLLRDGKENIEEFSRALAAEKTRKKKSQYLERFFYRDITNYKPQIKRYSNEFPKKNLLFLEFPELRDNPIKTYRKILKFLDLKYKKVDLTPSNVGKEMNVPRFVRLIRFFKSLPYPTQFFLKSVIPVSVRNWWRKTFYSKWS